MVAFEPSTWAEVKEAEAMGRTSSSGGELVAAILRYTENANAIHVELKTPRLGKSGVGGVGGVGGGTAPQPRSPSPVRGATKPITPLPPGDDTTAAAPRPVRVIRPRRAGQHFEDLLKLGRVDAKRGVILKGSLRVHERSLLIDATRPVSDVKSALNPSNHRFDARTYLQTLHSNITREQLHAGRAAVVDLEASLRQQAQEFITETFPNVLLAQGQLARARRIIANRSSPPPGAAEYAHAEEVLNARYGKVFDAQDDVLRLRHALSVVVRFNWVFTVSKRMRECANGAVAVGTDSLATDYLRAREWAEAQAGISRIRETVLGELDNALDVFRDALITRLSDPRATRTIMRKHIAALSGLGAVDALAEALDNRLNNARQALECSVRTQAGVKQLTAAFLAGLSAYMRLAMLVTLHEACAAHANTHLPPYIAYYVAGVEKANATVHRDAAAEVMRALALAVTLKVPAAHAVSLRKLADDTAINFVQATAVALTAAARQAAIAVCERRVKPAAAAQLIRAAAAEARAQAEDVRRRRRAGNVPPPPDDAFSNCDEALRAACANALPEAAECIMNAVAKASDAQLALRGAVFCACALRPTATAATIEAAPVPVQRLKQRLVHAQTQCVRAYVAATAPALEQRARRVVRPPNATDTLAGGPPAVSAAAGELVLELAVAAIEVRKRGAGRDVAGNVVAVLVARAAAALCSAAAATPMDINTAKAVRDDCDFLAAALGAQPNDDADGAPHGGIIAAKKIAQDAIGELPTDRRVGGNLNAEAAVLKYANIVHDCLRGE